MKPLRLEVHAFGPYANRQVLDFAELAGRSFFLIHGQTGAGKTSILDAICFALYGQSSGSGRTGRQLRSDHAAAATLTKVIFDFALRDESYRVIRIPEQDRPRRRGAGTARQDQEAEFYRRTGVKNIDDNGTALDANWSGVTTRVEELMGFKCDQFRQVVLLPQGKFQKLLMDDSADRQKVLETLFRVESYAKIEDALKHAAGDVRDKLKTARTRRDEVLRQAGVEKVDDLLARREAVEASLVAAQGQLQILRDAKAKTQAAVAAANDIAARLNELELATGQLGALEARKGDIELKRTERDRAMKAARLADIEAATAQRLNEAQSSARIAKDAASSLATALAARALADQKLQAEVAREPQREIARGEVAKLKEYDQKVTDLAHAVSLLKKSAEAKLKERDAARLSAEGALSRVNESLSAKNRDLAAAEQTALLVHERAEGKRKLDRELIDLTRLAELRKKLADAEIAFTKVSGRVANGLKTVEAARRKERELQSTWISALAASLAQDLSAGDPCPVCGSAHHPALASADHALPRKEEVEAARAEADRLSAFLDTLKTEQSAADSERRTHRQSEQFLLATMGDTANRNIEQVRRDAELAQKHLEEAESAGFRAAAHKTELTRLILTVDAAEKQLKDATAALTEAEKNLQVQRAIVAEREAGVPESLRSPVALAKAKAVAVKQFQTLTSAWETAQAAANQAALELTRIQAEADSAAQTAAVAKATAERQTQAFIARQREEGFENEDIYRHAKRSPGEVQRLDSLITAFEVEIHNLKDRVARAQAIAAGLDRPDMHAVALNDARAGDALEKGTRDEATLTAQLKQINDSLKSLHSLGDELADLDARYLTFGRLADVANGSNRYRVSFQRYVLGVFLDEVLEAANQRLAVMSHHRFKLQRTRDPADVRKAAGLDLEVHDAFTGTARAVGTLSGGESFLASLSLALGLADTVQEKAGGVHLETIFIDEGFGTLDPETLDLAIRALQDLQKGGRLVGIISHVTELREWIDARLEVTRTRTGSTARFVLS